MKRFPAPLAFLAFMSAHDVTLAFTLLDSSLRERSSQPFRISLCAEQSSAPRDTSASDLTNTLARLDKQWQIQQKQKPASRWTKLVLPSNAEEDVEETPPEVPSLSVQQDDFVYLLEPPNQSRPSCLIVFTGGAGLGTYPQIAYNEFLLRLSDRLNAAIITAPYPVDLNHFTLAKETGELTRRAIIYCQDDESRQYPESLPVYSLSHSLGSKLACIYTAATNQHYQGLGFISFNNFGFAKTIGMAKSFAEMLGQNVGFARNIQQDAIDGLFSFAEMAVSAIGIEFSPSPSEMERLVQQKYLNEQRKKTRLFTFDDDKLDNAQDFVTRYCANGIVPAVSALPGTHLTPVFFKLGLDELPEEAKSMASEAMGGFQSASFGNEEELETLVNEVCDWILGKAPARQPEWLRERPQIAATTPETP